MITVFNSKRIYRGFDSLKFNELRAWLTENGIEYRSRILTTGDYMLSGNSNEMRIRIRRKDYERVKQSGKI